MYVVGTAGHVDHGKSSLVHALTGIDPDRLREEKEREMTIDLGFAWLSHPNGYEIGIVDVPGHRDFIENMLAGVGGVDLALFVIAADEGVMPQTVEHLAILDLLEVKGGVIALTKIDMVEDPDWLELVILDVGESMAGTVLEDSPIVLVSSKSGEGIEEVREAIFNKLLEIEPKPDLGRPRMPIDRVFSLPGFGTIVTGTLSGGHLDVGDGVDLQPGDRQARIRGLQTHRTKLERAIPGSRVAVNLSGIHKDDVSRGDLLATPGVVTTTILCDVNYRHLKEAGTALKHNVPVKMFIGSTEVSARTRVLGSRQINPGESGWLQLVLDHSVALDRGDKFILRRPSPPQTLGGGKILDPHPGRKHRRYKSDIVGRLKMLEKGRPEDLLLEAIFRYQPAKLDQLVSKAGMSQAEVDLAYQELALGGKAEELGEWVLPAGGMKQWSERLDSRLSDHHAQFPLRLGIPREELRSRLRLPPAFFNELIDWAEEEHLLAQSNKIIFKAGHQLQFSAKQEDDVSQLMARFQATGVNSPSVKECKSEVGDDVYYALLELNKIRQVSGEVVYTVGGYECLVSQILEYLKQNGSIDAAKLRDLLGTSRKYAIALLEHLDDVQITKRVGDTRVLAT
ncbi:MAG TPA: selenocysteine-specific translation elongation factor [candidate division Zixibacteria bacterium]|nr:selenocysteine-specific translation elongation factor [candidate division Zixibacteria bacterium]